MKKDVWSVEIKFIPQLISKKPQITVYVDGPFLKDNSLNKKQQQKKLCDEIHECMVQRSKSSI